MPDDPTLPIGPETRPAAAGDGVRNNDLTGRTIGDYRIERLLGRGGCGSVYLAQDVPLDRPVALKVLGGDQSPAFSEDAVERFMREARAIASVEHPNIVQIHRVGREDDISYIVMQYVKGQTLSQRLRLEGPVSIADALLITLQVARALEAAHKIDLVHRDIKPANVMIDANGHVKVMDFGLARSTSPDTAITHTGMFVGTPRYSSPEQCETKSIDCRSDLYSLGVILYEMLAGTRPHEADTPLALMHKIVHEPPPSIREANPNVPADVAAIAENLLAKNPDDRYASAAELIVDVQRALDRLQDDSAQTFEPTIQIPTEAHTGGMAGGRRRALWLKIAAAAVVLTVIGFGVMRLMPADGNGRAQPQAQPQPPPKPPANTSVAVAVYDFANATKDPDLSWLELGVPDMLAANLGQYPYINLKTRDQVLWAMKPPPQRFDDQLRSALLPLKIRLVVKGSIYREKDQLRFVVHVYDLANNKNVGSVFQKGSVDTIFAAVDKLAGQITGVVSGFAASADGQIVGAAGNRDESVAGEEVAILLTRDIVSRRLLGQQPARKAMRRAAVDRVEEPLRGAGGAGTAAAGKAFAKGGRPVEPRRQAVRKKVEKKSAAVRDMLKDGKQEAAKRLPAEVDKELDAASATAEGRATAKAKKQTGELADSVKLGEGSPKPAAPRAIAPALAGMSAADAAGTAPDARALLPHYYRGRQLLLRRQMPREARQAAIEDLLEALRTAGSSPAALKAAYAKWEKDLVK